MWKILTTLSISFCSISSKWASWVGADSLNSMLCEYGCMYMCVHVCVQIHLPVYTLLGARSRFGVSFFIATVLILETRLHWAWNLPLQSPLRFQVRPWDPSVSAFTALGFQADITMPDNYEDVRIQTQHPVLLQQVFHPLNLPLVPASCLLNSLQRPCSWSHSLLVFPSHRCYFRGLKCSLKLISRLRYICVCIWSSHQESHTVFFHTTLGRMPLLLPFGSETSLFRHEVFFKMFFVCIVISHFKFVFLKGFQMKKNLVYLPFHLPISALSFVRSKLLLSFLFAWRSFYNPLELVGGLSVVNFPNYFSVINTFSILKDITCCWIVVHSVFVFFSPTTFWWGKMLLNFPLVYNSSWSEVCCPFILVWTVWF